MTDKAKVEQVYHGRYLGIAKRGTWEYATRTNATGVVAIVALHDDRRIVLVEQYRPAVDARVIELPAGLAGDEDDTESLLNAAKRELLEETGYAASTWSPLLTTCSSPGLTDEAITFYLARGLTKAGDGGGVGSESITIHEIPLANLFHWLDTFESKGAAIDMKLLAGAFAAATALDSSGP